MLKRGTRETFEKYIHTKWSVSVDPATYVVFLTDSVELVVYDNLQEQTQPLPYQLVGGQPLHRSCLKEGQFEQSTGLVVGSHQGDIHYPGIWLTIITYTDTTPALIPIILPTATLTPFESQPPA
jgi:hypothetical protein